MGATSFIVSWTIRLWHPTPVALQLARGHPYGFISCMYIYMRMTAVGLLLDGLIYWGVRLVGIYGIDV